MVKINHLVVKKQLFHILQFLSNYLQQFKGKYTEILAFRPSGWEFARNKNLNKIKPRKFQNVITYGMCLK